MINCLFCQKTIKKRQGFTNLLLLTKEKEQLCSECDRAFECVSTEGCPRCHKGGGKEVCTDCRLWEKQGYIVDHDCLYRYNPQMMAYMSQYKFHGDYHLRKVFAKELKIALGQWSDYTIVPIPLSNERYIERGFNQVIGLLEAAGVAYQPLLKKHHSTKQSEKTRQERLDTKQMFYIDEEQVLPEKVLLVDDVYTTGATLKLARELFVKKHKKIVKTFSLAR